MIIENDNRVRTMVMVMNPMEGKHSRIQRKETAESIGKKQQSQMEGDTVESDEREGESRGWKLYTCIKREVYTT